MKIILSVLLLVSTATVFAQVDFSGKWKLNVDKSQFNETPGTPAAPRLLVEQKGETVTFQRNDRSKETLKIDSPEDLELSEGENKTSISMKSRDDKKGLIETRTYSYPESETTEVAAKKVRTWSLSPDKKTLTIKDHIESTQGKIFDMELIYDRQ